MFKESSELNRRQFVKGVTLASISVSGIVDLSAQEALNTFDKSSVLSGEEFFLDPVLHPFKARKGLVFILVNIM